MRSARVVRPPQQRGSRRAQAKRWASMQETEHVQSLDGKITYRNSYGNDPYSPPG